MIKYYLFKPHSKTLTFVFEENSEFISHNQVYEATVVYLDALRSPETKRLNVHKWHKEIILLEDGEKLTSTMGSSFIGDSSAPSKKEQL